jgi:hypothetical protein
MYDFLRILELGLFLVVAWLVVSTYVFPRWGERRRAAVAKGALDKAQVINEATDARDAQRQNLSFMGVPSVDAGNLLLNVPALRPEQEGAWKREQEELVTARAIAYMAQGQVPTDLVELANGYLLIAVAGKAYLLKHYPLTAPEEQMIQHERQYVVGEEGPAGPGDQRALIDNFQGLSWQIKSAAGRNVHRKPGERECSYLQVLSFHRRLGQPGIESTLPTGLFDGLPYDYYDIKETSSKDDRVLYAFFAAGRWSCFIGRALTEAEAAQLQGI